MKRILFRAFALLIGLSFVLISLELFLRMNPKLGYNYSSFRIDSQKKPSRYFNEAFNKDPDHQSRYRPSSILGFEHVPNSRPQINSYGLVGKEYKLKKDKNTFRILLLGDSIAEQGWPAEFLEEELSQDPQLGKKYKFEIWNAGVGAYDVRQYYLYLIHKGLNYKPDLVMIFLFMNDFQPDINVYYKKKGGFTAYYLPLKELCKRGFIINPFLAEHSYLYRFVVLRLNAYLSVNKRPGAANEMEEEGKCYLSRIKEVCRRNKMPLLIVIFPYLQPPEEYSNYQTQQYEISCKVTKELAIKYIDLYGLYNKLLREGLNIKEHNDDRIHPSKQAHKLIAREIYSYMLAKPELVTK